MSHIIPAFVFRWLKKDGPIRYAGNVDRRVQDGSKMYMLCSPCESRLNELETEFANKIFHPINADGHYVAYYGEWLLRFCASISWRSLSYTMTQAQLSHFSGRQNAEALKALDTWRDFILGKLPNPGRYEQHIVPFSAIQNTGGFDFPPNINRYLVRTVDIDVAAGERSAFIYSKLGRFGIFGFIDVLHPREWEGTKIRVRQGQIGPGAIKLPYSLVGYLSDRSRKVWTLMQCMSEKQQQKVDSGIISNPDRFLNSEVFRAMQEDVRLFGSNAFSRKG